MRRFSFRSQVPALLGFLVLGQSCGLWAAPAKEAADEGPGVSLTVYNQDFAVVKEQRLTQLAEGTGVVKFPEVAATIIPESVQFTSLHPAPAKVLEQNYEFDLVSADKLLDKYIDKSISIVGRDGSLIEGRLLSADGGHLVLANQNGVQLIPRQKHIKDIRFASLPEGLLLRPTLVWKVRAQKAGEHLVRIAYAAKGMQWRVDYRAVVSADEKTMDVAGWVTINNHSGTTFRDAALKLMAGDLHYVQQTRERVAPEVATLLIAVKKVPEAGFEEKAFAEYHLYTLGRRTTLASAQTKQIELLKVEGIPVAKSYLYRPQFGARVGTMLEFKNSKETRPGLGIPLPKGPFRVYQVDKDKQAEFVGQDEIDHTPKDEPVRVRLGYAFDLAAERVQTGQRQKTDEKWIEQDWRISLRNHKPQPVPITVEEPLEAHHKVERNVYWPAYGQPARVVVDEPLAAGANWQLLRCSQQYKKKDFRTLEFDVAVPADGQTAITYTVRYTW